MRMPSGGWEVFTGVNAGRGRPDEACRGQYCDRPMTGLDAVGNCGVFGLEFLVGVDVVGEGDKEGVVLQIDHRGIKLLDLAQC